MPVNTCFSCLNSAPLSIYRRCYRILFAIIFLIAGCNNNNQSSVKETSGTLFTLLPAEQTNIHFQNTLTEGLNTNILLYEYFYNGGGVAAGDFNHDGLTDLYFTSNMAENKLYLNKGNMRFEDITAASGTAGRPGPWKTGVNAVDINADGRLDIYLCYSGAMPAAKRANQLFINMGNDSAGIPSFLEKAEEYGLASTGFSNQSYFFDYDRDGDLDMLLLNHHPQNLPLLNETATDSMLKTDDPEKGLRLLKQSNGKFEDVTAKSGINGSPLSYGLGLCVADFNNDGWPDFYVSNDYSVPDYLYINHKNGTFTNELQNSMGHTSQFSMGNDAADINNDALTDIYTLDMLPEDNNRQKLLLSPDNYEKFNLNLRSGFYYQYMRNMLQLNNGNGTFSEIGQIAGISNTDWSWSALFADYDNDGWKDLHVTNGYLRDYTNLDFINYMNEYVNSKGRLQREDVMGIIQNMPSSNVNNYIFQNKQHGAFANTSAAWGLQLPSNSNGAVYADLDNDGDLDLAVNNINQPAFIFRNRSQEINHHHYLQIQLKGKPGNTQGIGARVTIFHNKLMQTLEQNPARGYLSSVAYTLHFGLGKSEKIDSLIVTWAGGATQKMYAVTVNRLLQLNESDALDKPVTVTPPSAWFTKLVPPVQYTHKVADVNDFNRQPLLTSQLSYNGPCITSFDMNHDGLNDLIIGGGYQQPLSIHLQQKNKTFLSQKTIPAFEADKVYNDAAIAILDANADGAPDIYAASGGYHQLQPGDSLLQDRLYINNGKNVFYRSNGLPAVLGSKSCVAVQDINADGAPDIFVAARVIPGRYPEFPQSFILINDGKGNFSDQTESICPELKRPGMITDALWVDLDMDKKNELVIAGEWMHITVYQLQDGKLINATDQFFSKKYTGWWNKLATGDFNGDGKPDLVAGNMGVNTQFSVSESRPMEMYYADFDHNGYIDPLLSCYIKQTRHPYITRDELLNQLPMLKKRFADFKSYANITTDELFTGNELKKAGHLLANYMETTCFLSNTATKKLTPAVLPIQAQYAPVYTITATDFNRDGNTDILLCGNNSRTKIRLGKFDASYGTLLEGDGEGNFKYIPQTASGLNIWGDVRSCVQTGETLLFGINGAPLVSYKITSPKK